MTIREFGPFAPDRVPSIDIVVGGKNVLPRSDKAYGPVQAFQPIFNPLDARCQGSFYAITATGITLLFAATKTKLYVLASGMAFTDETGPAGPYNAPDNEFWEFEQFGNVMIATQINNFPQYYDIDTPTTFLTIPDAPKAKHVGAVSNFLMFGNTEDQPDGLWWSAINDPLSWPIPATSAAAAVQSGRVNISGRGGAIQKIVPRVGTLDAIILQERQVSRVAYVGTPDVFQIQPMEGARGTPAPGSVAVSGGNMFYLGDDGFYQNDGTQSLPIGAAQVDEFFFADVNQTLLHRICAEIDPVDKVYIVAYPSGSSDGELDKMLMYSYASQRWAPPTECDLEYLTKLGSVGYTLEDLDPFGNIDVLLPTLDSKIWMGDGKPVLAAFNTAHRAGTFNGEVLEAILETGDIDEDSARVLSYSVRPLVQGGPTVPTCAYGYRQARHLPVTYSNYGGLNRELYVPFRVNARHVRTLTRLAPATTWTHLAGFDLLTQGISNL